ncbi:MAG: phage/plasmid replication protein, II/X family [Zhongshania sp.]|uniref:phage/plasmid replication protein, II/X family n=1 Tax=Zhongshania sp. TaxID=1971902 RepID=UPI0026154E94|nr:phage/plasmid replication protein, II/X family [Zhongshania sp.]MDF1693292.1 phage/plasmid replication protein, II/X family [Zhongshania sp.]MDF1693303.1 phage/plasmid replication protein, II/X family [Zhongshania sp.]
MLIDWVTSRISLEDCSESVRAAAVQLGDRVVRYCPITGEVRYEVQAWDSIRSDSHQISVRCTSDLWIQGSPARIMGDGCAVFGSGASRALDLMGCVTRMIAFVTDYLGAGALPDPSLFRVSRVDVTSNLLLGSHQEVLQGLQILRNCEGGRYRISQQRGETCYWNHGSKLRSGKAYSKGPHLIEMMKKPDYTGRQYSPLEIQAAMPLLRLELSLKREFFLRNDWRELTPADLNREWCEYFERMIGGADMVNESDLKTKILKVAPTDGQGKAAYGCWAMIQSQGWEKARDCYTKTTWYRNLKILRSAGLGDADISAGKVVALRQRIIEAQQVSDWSQLVAA